MSDFDDVSLVIFDDGTEIKLWHSYEFQSDFLTPTDSFTFMTGSNDVFKVRDLARRLLPGTRVSLVVNGRAQATGYVVASPVTANRKQGATIIVKGYDALWPMVNSSLDPSFVMTEGTTLRDLVVNIGTQFGITKYSTTAIADRSVVTGRLKANTLTKGYAAKTTVSEFEIGGTKYTDTKVIPATTERYDPTKPKFLKDTTLKQMQPRPGEGAFQFLSKACRRFETWAWINALGDELIVAPPEFDQPASYELHNDGRGNVNYDYGQATIDGTNQPSVIIATGHGSTPTSAKSKLKIAMVNELTGFDENGNMLPDVVSAIKRSIGCKVLETRPALIPFARSFRNNVMRPCYLHDDESKTLGQLESFVRHEMAQRQSKGIVLRYVVPGHSQANTTWATNTVVQVDDDVLDYHEPMWIKSRSLTKSRDNPGTVTTIDVIRLNTLDLKA